MPLPPASPRNLLALGSFTLLSSFVAGNLYAARSKRPAGVHAAVVQPEQFNRLAPQYDQEIASSERRLGVEAQRKGLAELAADVTLEIACGTGRNSAYYTPRVTRLILCDASSEMLAEARKKPAGVPTEYMAQDAHELRAFLDESVDTVVDTFGLCSFHNPDQVLAEVRRVLKPRGQLLMLEHGRAENTWFINLWLDFRAASHAQTWGCLWNRPIPTLVRNAGFAIHSIRSTQLGTVYEIVAVK
jgi:methyltransferase OMS1